MSLEKLEKQLQEVQSGKTLEQQQSELIKSYTMKEGRYKIIITIYEANDLMAKAWSLPILNDKSACDSFVQITIKGQSKKTQVKSGTNNPIFDQSFYFSFPEMSVQEIKSQTIEFKVYDTSMYIVKKPIGIFQLDWTNVYFKRNHQIYRGWLTLADPQDQKQQPAGYLLVNIAVLSQQDKITVHDSAYIKNPLTTMEETVTNPKIRLIDYCINIQIYRAENLLPYDQFSRNVDAYVVAKFSGNKIETSTRTSLNPEWNQLLKLAANVPTKSKYLVLEIWNSNILTFKNDLLGLLRIPFTDICDTEQKNDQIKPKWGHLYGPPMAGKDFPPQNYAFKMQYYGDVKGSTYRGRLLYRVTGVKDVFTKNIKSKMKFQFPYKPLPVVPMKSYVLRIQLLQGVQLPIRPKTCFQVGIGQYLIRSNNYKEPKAAMQFSESIRDIKVQFPQDITQLPDIIVYYCKGQSEADRMTFKRIPAKQALVQKYVKNFKIYEMQIDKSLNLCKAYEIGGYVTMRVTLFEGMPPPPADYHQFEKKQNLTLKIFLYQGQSLPCVNQSGDCDPLISFNFCGVPEKSEVKKESCNPIWNQVISIQVQTQNLFQNPIQKALICSVYDSDSPDYKNQQSNYIGKFIIPISQKQKKLFKLKAINKSFPLIHHKPKWYYIINNNIEIGNNIFGRVLISYALFKTADVNQIPLNKINTISPEIQSKNLQIYVVGLRNIAYGDQQEQIKSKNYILSLKLPDLQPQAIQTSINRFGGCNINKMKQFNARLHKNKCISPFIDIKFIETIGQQRKFLGYNSVNLYQLLPKLKNSILAYELNHDEQQTILNVENLEAQLMTIKQKRMLQNLKNKASEKYNSKLVDNLPVPGQLQQISDTQVMYDEIKLDLQMLLKKFEEDYIHDPQYNYVRQLQRTNDSKQNTISQFKIQGDKFQNQFEEQEFLIKSKQVLALGQRLNYKQQLMKSLRNDKQQVALSNKPLSKISPRLQNINELHEVEQSSYQRMKEDKDLKYDISQRSYEEKSLIIDINSDKAIQNDQKDLKNRYKTYKQNIQTVSDFEIKPQDIFSQQYVEERAVRYKHVQKAIKQQQQHQKQARQRQQQYRYAAAVKLSLFKTKKKKNKIRVESYEAYDTDPQENLDIIPDWYKGRQILINDFQQFGWKQKKLHSINLYRGTKQQKMFDLRLKERIATLKMIVLSEDKNIISAKQKQYAQLLKPKTFMCRIYVLKGKSLISNYEAKPTTYLKFTYGMDITNIHNVEVKQENNPQYYTCFQCPVQLPGPSTVRIDVMEKRKMLGGILKDKHQVLGFTQIDLQDRYLNKKWHLYVDKKPIQLRNLNSDYGGGTQGRLQVWVDLIKKKDWLKLPMHKIHPPPFYEYQLRIIVWKTKDCVIKNHHMQSNDVFVRGFIGKLEPQQTDTHFACRGTGSFNYRFKFLVNYPPKPEDMYSDVFIVQIWDRDLVGFNNLIGQTRINLNKMHRMIQKAVKRRKSVKASMKIREEGLRITDQFWFPVFNHREKNQFGELEPQGQVQLSFELVPAQEAKQTLKNGYGRSEPNVYPTLPQPTGRLRFNILNPCGFIEQILGKSLYRKCCCGVLVITIIVIIVVVLVLFGTQLGAVAVIV